MGEAVPLPVTVGEAEGVTVGVALVEGVAVGDRVGGGEGDAPQSSCRTAERSAT